MRTRRHALHERIRAKEFQLKEVLRRLDRQRLLQMFPPGVHPDTPLRFRQGDDNRTVYVEAPLTVIIPAEQRVWQVDPSPVPNPVGGFQDITIPSMNVDASLDADSSVNFAGQSANTYIVYASHIYREENAESREPPGIFADGAGVNPTHREFFDHGQLDGAAIPREAFDPSLTPTTVFEVVDRVQLGFALQNNVPPTAVPLLRVTLNTAGNVNTVNDISRFSDVRNIRGFGDALNAHIGAAGNAHPVATTAEAGFMSAADKTKLNNAPANTGSALANKADLIGGRVPTSQLPTSSTANRVLKVTTANSTPSYEQVNFNELAGTIANSQIPNSEIQDAKLVGISASKVSGTLADGNIPNLNASKVTAGSFHADRIPNLDTSKITSGTLADARIPNLNASKITAGIFVDARIPNLAASKITSGAFHVDRIPNLAAGKITSGTFDAGRIPSLDAAKIGGGSFHVDRIPGLDAAKITSGTFHADRVSGLFGSGGTPGTNRVTIDGTRIGTGTVPYARLPVGTGASQVAAGNHTHSGADFGAAPASHNHSASQINSGVIATSRLPIGSHGTLEIAPGQDMSASGDAKHPRGCIRMVLIPGSGNVVPGNMYSSVSVGAFGFRRENNGVVVITPGDSRFGALPGTWQAISGAYATTDQTGGSIFLAVRTA